MSPSAVSAGRAPNSATTRPPSAAPATNTVRLVDCSTAIASGYRSRSIMSRTMAERAASNGGWSTVTI